MLRTSAYIGREAGPLPNTEPWSSFSRQLHTIPLTLDAEAASNEAGIEQ